MPMSPKFNSLKYNPFTAKVMKLLLSPFIRELESVIFVATTGRSGTASLAKILAEIDDSVSFHETYPLMNDSVMYAKNQGDDRAARHIYDHIKSINIRRHAMGRRYYIETSHIFIKAFVDYVAEDFSDKLKVIHLYRDPIKVANSIAALNHEPGTDMGNNWYLDYQAPQNIINVADALDAESSFNNAYMKSLWYWYEIEARIQYWREKLPAVPFYDLNTKDLNNGDKLCALLDKMQIRYKREKILDVSNTRENRKIELKKHAPIEDKSTRVMHASFKQLLLERGYSLPPAIT